MNLNIYDFTDYKLFLQSYVDIQKTQKPHWNLSRWGQELGLGSRSLLVMVLNGTRSPSQALTQKLLQYLKFDQKASDYFKALIQLEKYRQDPDIIELVIQKLKKLSPKGEQLKILDPKIFQLISKWYYYSIRELTFLNDFRPDPKWISKKLNFTLSEKQIKTAIEHLIELKLLRWNGDNKLVASESSVSSTEEIPSIAIRNFHKESLENAKKSLERDPVDKRHFSGITCAMSVDQFKKIKKMISRFEDELMDELQKGDLRDSVYQFNFQLFPLTKYSEKTQKEIL